MSNRNSGIEHCYLTFDTNDPKQKDAFRILCEKAPRKKTDFIVGLILSAEDKELFAEMVAEKVAANLGSVCIKQTRKAGTEPAAGIEVKRKRGRPRKDARLTSPVPIVDLPSAAEAKVQEVCEPVPDTANVDEDMLNALSAFY